MTTTTATPTSRVRRLLEPAMGPERLAVARILICGFATAYVIIRLGHLWAVTELDSGRFRPVGVVSLLRDSPVGRAAHASVLVATVGAGVGATVGWRHRVTGPAFGMLLLWTLSYRLSWGQVLHTENLMALHVVVLGFSRSADAASIDNRNARRSGHVDSIYSWPLQLMTLLTALTYAIAAWAKIRNGGLEWMTGDALRNQIAYDNLRKHLLGDVHSSFGGWLTRYRWLFPPLATASMVVEIGAVLAVVPHRLRYWWVASAWAFHAGVLALMAILFPYQLLGLAFVSLLPVERLLSLRRRRSLGGSAAPSLTS